PLQEMFNNAHLRNRGIGGNTRTAIKQRVDEVCEGHPAKVFIELGINDITGGDDPQTILMTLDSICQKIMSVSPETKIYLQSILPTAYGNKKYNSVISDYNLLLKEYSTKSGHTYINTHDAFLDGSSMNTDLTTDGIHLTGKGYLVWKSVIKKYL
ncbi:MAG: GDSL-type esterase/lipase family protein, partial [Chitinophagaceae bacterium]